MPPHQRADNSTREAADHADGQDDPVDPCGLAGSLEVERERPRRSDFAVGLCGGVFQNRRLADTAQALLEQAGFRVYLPVALPANDAAISFGQIVEASLRPDTRS